MPAFSFWEFAMAAKKEISPELLAEAQRLYEQTLAPVDDIGRHGRPVAFELL